ncbi:uncharacterized protein [Eleutherodactylus coqui]|uniref:uncharacterized protein n=1 Tax=Eleutherodactylus coqui TaxID=57060 RepID=UPI0034625C5F
MCSLTGLVSLVCYPCAFLGLVFKYTFSTIGYFLSSRRVVGIFSRSSSNDYEWLTRALNSFMFTQLVKESRSVYISNREKRRFQEAVHDCDFTILYHTKNHGRINITNVMDALYDEELQYMSSSRGRENVIVIVDDLEKGGDEEKCRIMEFQPDIMTFSQDLILVTREEKGQPHLLDQKLQLLKALASNGSWSIVDFWDYLVSMTRWVCTNAVRGRRRGELDEPLLI